MKHLSFNQGGQPIYLDDINALQEQVSNLRQLVSWLINNQLGKPVRGQQIAILHPDFWTDNTHGVIIYNGEVLNCSFVIGEDLTDTKSYTGAVHIGIRRTEKTREMRDGTTKVVSHSFTGAGMKAPVSSAFTENFAINIELDHWQDYWICTPNV